jgi:hypothetical protein
LRAPARIPPARFLAALAAILGLILLTTLDYRPVEAGIFSTLLRFDISLPLGGFGLALALESRRPILVILAVMAFGIVVGAGLAEPIARAIETDFRLMGYLFFIGPAYCLVTGAALVSPDAVRRLLLPVAALLSGAILGLSIPLVNPRAAEIEFATGALLAGLALVLVPLMLLAQVQWPGLRIIGRILGSWLIALGLMQIGLQIARIQPDAAAAAYIGLM